MDGGEPEEPRSSINTTDREYDTTTHDPQQQSVTSCIGLRPTAYPVYVTLLLLFVTNSINTTLVSESVIYNKVCYETFTNLTLCTNTTFTRHHPLLQEDAAKWAAYMSAVQIVPSVATNMMLSSYCDTTGFKLPITLPLIGQLLYSILLSLLAYPQFLHWPMYTLILSALCYGSFGGGPLLQMSSYAYLSRITKPDKRSFSMAVLEGSAAAGCLVGMLGGGAIQTRLGLSITAFVSAGIALAPILITAVFTVELPPRVNNSPLLEVQGSSNTPCLNRIGVMRMLDAIKCVFKKREHHKRTRLNLCYLANSAANMAANGLVVNSFLYFHKQYELTISSYTIYFSYLMGVVAVGGPVIMKAASLCLNFNSATIGMLAAAFLAIGYAVMSIGVIPHGLWIGGAFLAFQSVVYASARSYAVRLVRTDEIGKIFAYDAMLQVLLQILSAILFKWIYSITVEHWAGFFVAFCGLLCLISSLSLFIVSRLNKTQSADDEETTPLLS